MSSPHMSPGRLHGNADKDAREAASFTFQLDDGGRYRVYQIRCLALSTLRG